MIAQSAWLLPALPAFAALAVLVAGPQLGTRGAWLAVLATLVPTVLSIWMLLQTIDRLNHALTSAPVIAAHRIATLGPLSVSASTRVDGLAALLCVVVTVVALCVQVYSTAYMRDDSRYSSYAAFVSLFTAAMLIVVLSGDLLWLLVGWEVMGICSYLLIGHHWEDKPNTDAAISAFIVTRFGDLGFTAGLAVFAIGAGSTSISTVLGATYSHTTLVVGSLLLLMGVVGKSAQFPLQTWLPEAMAGPTPVSALIHAATMVAAGVYVVDRLAPIALTGASSATLAVIASITMVFAALCALAQEDLKRVLAWSTVSQLAYMYAGLAMHSNAGIAHLVTHAAFKALLFLAAGCVAHAVGSTLMSKMGGLRRGMPLTFISMTVGLATLGGFPMLSGFVTKDAVLESAWSARETGVVATWAAWLVLVAGVVTAVITAAYCVRVWLRVFAGRAPKGVRPHDPPLAMSAPVLFLTIPSAFVGLLLTGHWFEVLLFGDPTTAVPLEGVSFTGVQGGVQVQLSWALVSSAAAAVGAGTLFLVWRAAPHRDPARILGRSQAFIRDGMRMGELYVRLFVRPLRDRFAPTVATIDRRVIDGGVVGTGRSAVGLGGLLRRTQTGNVQLYITVLLVGVLALAVGAVAL